MKTPTWTKADAKRAEKMGFELLQNVGPIIVRKGDRFKSDDEAIEWVIQSVEGRSCVDNDRVSTGWTKLHEATCRKALFLCAKG